MIMIVKTPGSQMGFPAAAEGGGEARGGGRGGTGERSEVQARSTLESTAPKARSRSREVVTLDEAPRILPRVSSKLLSSASSSSSSVITALARISACPSATATFARTSASVFNVKARGGTTSRGTPRSKRDRKVYYKTTTNRGKR